RLRHSRLAGRGENKPIDHLTHNARFRLVVSDCIGIVHSIYDRRRGHRLRSLGKPGGDGAKKNKSYVSHQHGALEVATDFMSNGANHNSTTVGAAEAAAFSGTAGDPPSPGFGVAGTAAATGPIRHIYVQASATSKSAQRTGDRRSMKDLPSTIYFGGGTPTALTTAQL